MNMLTICSVCSYHCSHYTVACLFSDLNECADKSSVCSYHYTVACLFSDINEYADKSNVCSYQCCTHCNVL